MNLTKAARQLSKGDERPRLRMDPATLHLMKAMVNLSRSIEGAVPHPSNIADRAIIFYANAWLAQNGDTAAQVFPILDEVAYLLSEYPDILDLSIPKAKVGE